MLIAALCGAMAVPMLAPVRAAPRMQAGTNIVISQVYGGGGNSGAPYLNDFVELYNPSNSSISVNGWSLQYASATGTAWLVTNLPNVSIEAGQYFLIQMASGGTNGVALPTPDLTGAISMSATAGKVALLNITTALSGSGCPFDPSVVDFIGYGTTANCSEGASNAPAPSNTTADLRNGNGSIDTDNNNLDFTAAPPTPRTTLSPTSTVTPTVTDTGTVTSTPTETTMPTITLTPTETSTSTVTQSPTITPTPTNTALTPATNIVISEFRFRGSGGASDEFIELFNPTGVTVNLNGWKIRGTNSAGVISDRYVFTTDVFLAPNQHFLISNILSVDGVPADATYPTGITSDGGVALTLSDDTIIDAAGITNCATCFFEAIPLALLTTDADRSYDRKSSPLGICVDSDVNAADFFLRNPSNPQNSSSPILTTCGSPTPTPTATRTPTVTKTATKPPTASRTPTSAPAQLIAINEFVPRPGRDWNNDGLINTGDEYIELINYGTISVNLNGWTLDDEVNIGSAPYRITSITLRPGERIVFYGSQTGLLLSDGGDGVRLLKPSGGLVDAFNYNVVNYPDQSFCRLPDTGGRLRELNRNCYPTPGLPNSLGSAPGSSTSTTNDSLCPIADTLPHEFYLAECDPFGNNIWSRFYWDNTGWYGELKLPNTDGKWDVFAD